MFPQQPVTRSAGTPAPVAGEPVAKHLPQSWDDARDTAFFSITARLFTPAATLGMTVLLASYDDDPAPVRSHACG